MGIVKYLVICLCLAFAATPLFAQEGEPVQEVQPRLSPSISPEDTEAAWKLEALCFSHNLKLSEENSAEVVREYTDSRMRLQEAIQTAIRGGTGDSLARNRPGMGGNTALMLSQLMNMERIKLLKNLRPLLAETQLEHALLTLGSFSHDWDRLVHTITGFEFSREKMLVALTPIEVFIAGMSDTQKSSGGYVEMQQQLQARRVELLTSMSNLLNDEQIKTFHLEVETVKIRTWQNPPRKARRKGTRRDSGSEPKKRPLPRKLRRYDANGDGKLTREELPEFLHRRLDQFDANKDGILDAEELKEIKDKFG